MLRTELEKVRGMASEIAKRAVKGEVDPIIKQIDELATRIAALEKAAKPEAKPKGMKDGKL